MKKHRELIVKLAIFLSFLAFLCFCSYIKDGQENSFDKKMNQYYSENAMEIHPYCYNEPLTAAND